MPDTYLSKLGIGILNGYLMRRERDLQQQDKATQRGYDVADQATRFGQQQQLQTQADEAAQKRVEAGYTHEGDVYDRNLADAKAQQDLEYKRNVFKSTIEAADPEELAKITDADIAQLSELVDGVFTPEQVRTMLNLNRRVKLKATGGGAGGAKERKPTDISLLKTDLSALLGFTPASEAIMRFATYMDKTGDSAQQALPFLYPDQSTIPIAKDSGGGLHGLAQGMRDLETTNPDIIKRAAANGIKTSGIVKRIQDGEEPYDAERHETADMYAAAIQNDLGIDPRQPIDMAAINRILTSLNPPMRPITGEDQRAVTNLVDEMLTKEIGIKDKAGQYAAILKIIQDALTPQTQRGPKYDMSSGSMVPIKQPPTVRSDIQAARAFAPSPTQSVAFDPNRFRFPGRQGNAKP